MTQANFAPRKQGNVFSSSQKHCFFMDANFASCVATAETIRRNSVSAAMFPRLARALIKAGFHWLSDIKHNKQNTNKHRPY